MMHKSFVTINNLSLNYSMSEEKELKVLNNIDLLVKKGEFVSIVGPSGCGKSTLLNCMSGLLKPSNGHILFEGRNITKPFKKCSMVFQNHSLLPWRNVINNIKYGIELQGIDNKKREVIAQEMISLVRLNGFEKFYPHQLSGGMKQRVNLARALAADPEILLMDEPFASLDAQSRELMQFELLRIWQKNKKTVLFVTHQINEAIYLSDKVIVLSARPARIKEVIDIRLPRPRDLEIKLTDKFIKLEKYIWKLIMEEVEKN